MAKWPQLSAQNKTDLMPNNASCKRWDTPRKIARGGPPSNGTSAPKIGYQKFNHLQTAKLSKKQLCDRTSLTFYKLLEIERIMKALSVRQPWSWLIVQGFKPIENRTWQTSFRGTVLIHAGMKIDEEGYEEVRARFPEIPLPPIEELDRGGIVGQCDIIDCVSQSDSQWFSGPYGFVIENAMPLPFRPLPGKLGFFDVELADQP